MAFFHSFVISKQSITTKVFPKTFGFIPILPMCLSSLNRSNSKVSRHIMPYSAPLCKILHYSKTGVPWQMNRILIIVFSLLKCLVLPYFTHFFEFLQELQFSENCSGSGKIRQFENKCSSL